MVGFISLPRNRLHKKRETTRLNNLPSNLAESRIGWTVFYKDWLDSIDFLQSTDFQQQLANNTPSEGDKKYILATSEFGEEILG